MWKKVVIWVLVVALLAFVGIQFVPYGRPITTPPVTNAFKWSDPQAAQLAQVACYDCHSNTPKVWWGVEVAPMNWLAQRDATRGRSAMNFSAWTGFPKPEQFAESVSSGRMPPATFWIVHPDAKLDAAKQKTLIDGFQASYAANPAPKVPADVQSIIDGSCGSCHPTSLALGYRAESAKQALGLIKSMVVRGAKLTNEQQQVLVQYFVHGN